MHLRDPYQRDPRTVAIELSHAIKKFPCFSESSATQDPTKDVVVFWQEEGPVPAHILSDGDADPWHIYVQSPRCNARAAFASQARASLDTRPPRTPVARRVRRDICAAIRDARQRAELDFWSRYATDLTKQIVDERLKMDDFVTQLLESAAG